MLDFPGPGGLTVGQVFTSAGKSWQWDGAKWAAAAGGGAPLDSPSFTGDPKAPTPATADNDTSIATTAFVKAQGYLLNNQVITLSGDLTGAGATAIAATLATVNANVGTFQGLTLDAKGRVTAAANQSYLTGNQSITLSGDISGSGATAITTTLATVPVAKGGTGATTAPAALTNLGAVAKAGDTMSGTLSIGVAAGVQSRLNLSVATVRTWGVVCDTDGTFAVSDVTGSNTSRLAILTSGACYNTTGTWNALSDASLKQTVTDYTSGLAEICALRPVTFSWLDEEFGPKQNWGLIAQEVEPVMPELVSEIDLSLVRAGAEPQMVKTIDYGRTVFALINAVKELRARLETLETR